MIGKFVPCLEFRGLFLIKKRALDYEHCILAFDFSRLRALGCWFLADSIYSGVLLNDHIYGGVFRRCFQCGLDGLMAHGRLDSSRDETGLKLIFKT